LKLSSIESGESTSGGTVYAPGLEPYRVGVTINEYEVSLWMSGETINIGTVYNANRSKRIEEFAYKSLRDASRNIAMRLLGSVEAVKQHVDCQPLSEYAYCVTTKRNAQDVLNWFIDTYSPSDRSMMDKGYANQAFQFTDKTEITKSLYVSIDFKRSKTVDTYLLWDSDYKRKNFKIIYIPSATKGKNILRIEASWVDGYSPSPEEK
jgi:hypothetical protein